MAIYHVEGSILNIICPAAELAGLVLQAIGLLAKRVWPIILGLAAVIPAALWQHDITMAVGDCALAIVLWRLVKLKKN